MSSKRSDHKRLIEDLWNSEEVYYDLAQKGSVDFTGNTGLQIIQQICHQSHRILDCGCGEGQKLSMMSPQNGVSFGVDISQLALKRAKRFPEIRLVAADLENLPFADQSFDATYSAYVIEHVQNPESVLKEMIRVTKSNGYVMVIAPNYGSPIFPSPPSQVRTRFRTRGIRRLFQTHLDMFRLRSENLNWDRVQPLPTKAGEHKMDWDTTVEPYLHTLIKYLNAQRLKIIDYSSQFEMLNIPPILQRDTLSVNKSELLVRLLSHLIQRLAGHNIPPYRYFGPVCFVVAQK